MSLFAKLKDFLLLLQPHQERATKISLINLWWNFLDLLSPAVLIGWMNHVYSALTWIRIPGHAFEFKKAFSSENTRRAIIEWGIYHMTWFVEGAIQAFLIIISVEQKPFPTAFSQAFRYVLPQIIIENNGTQISLMLCANMQTFMQTPKSSLLGWTCEGEQCVRKDGLGHV